MIATRITRRAATIVAVTLLAAGTAAAASGALPAFSDTDPPADVAFVPASTVVESTTTEASEVVVTTTTAETTATSDVETDGDATDDVAELPVAEPDATVHDPKNANNFGKCTAWTHGAKKKLTNPAFAELQTAADDGTVSVDEYCAATIAAHEAEHGDDEADEADEADVDQADDDQADDDQADDVDDEDDADEVGRGNGKSDHGSATRGKGHGTHD